VTKVNNNSTSLENITIDTNSIGLIQLIFFGEIESAKSFMKWIAFATHLKTGHAIISLMVPFEHSVLTISNFAT